MNALTYGLTHISVAVSDLKRTQLFYQKVFDMELQYAEEDFIQLSTPGAQDVIVFTKAKDEPIGSSGGIHHFGFRLKDPKDIDIVVQKAIDAGAVIIDKGEFVRNSPYVFFRDPDGYEIEVWYEETPQQ